MEKRLHFTSFDKSVFIKSVIIIICFFSFFSVKAFSQASVSTDQSDYAPGSTVYITGSGFAPKELVTLQVLHVGGGDDLTSPAHQPWTVTADSLGNISSTWYVPTDQDEVGATLQLTATGQTSGLIAQAVFTDSPPAAPIISYNPASNSFPVNSAITTWTPTNSGGSSNNYTVSHPLPAGLSISKTTGAITGTPITVTAATKDTVTATNVTGSSSFVITITVTQILPHFTYPTPNIFVAGTAIVTLKPTNTGGAPDSYSISPTLPTGLLFNTANGEITGTPTAVTPATDYIVTATNSAGSTTFTVNITVNPAKPIISYTTPPIFIVGTAISALDPTNSGGAAASYSISPALPTGLSINGTTGEISGTPSVVSPATSYTVTATNVTGSGTTSVNITVNPALPAITYPTPDIYVYGTSIATLSPTSSGGAVASYSVSPTLPAGLTLNTGTGVISGKPTAATAAKDYTVTATNVTGNGTYVVNITVSQRPLHVTASGNNKVYDGTTTATVNLNDDRLPGDKLTLTYTANFLDKNAAQNKTINVTNIAISGGADAANYVLANTTTTTTANISPRTLTVTATGVNKVYDGNTTATVTLSDDRILNVGDTFTDSYTTATFADKNVNNGITVSVSGISISGTGSGNYTLNSITTASTTANITPKTLTVTATGVNKVYDGNTTATVTLSDDRILNVGDTFTDSYTTATFADKNVNNGITVSVSGISISGTGSGNYTLNSITTASTTANITPKTLTVTATGVNKVYDGNTTATVTLSDDRILNVGDTFTDSYTTATFADKNVNNEITVSVSGISISGTGSGNYTLNSITTASTTANITPKTLTVTATGVNKVYDGNTTATVTLSDDRILNVGDTFTDSYTTATFADKNVNNGITVSVSGISISGTGSGNYTLNSITTASTTANITPKTLTVTTTGVNKVYDGNTTATVTLSDDRILNVGDTFTDSYTTATFADKNVNNGITVSVSGISISGTGSGNYTLNSITTASTTANITPKTLTVTATGVNKVYDGNTTATVTLSDDRILNVGDTFTDSYTTATFADKNVNNGITVSVSGISISGTGSGNYTLNSITTASTTANITPKTLTVTATGVNKVYDGNTTATVTLSDDRILNVGDTFTDSYTTATFADKNVNNGITVSVSGISISGTGSGNYTLNSITTASTTANITPKTLTVTATGVNKVYDGNTTATVTLSDDRILNVGDTFTDSYTTATFADKNVNNGITVSVSGISISGTGSGNYTLNSITTASTTANITPKTLTVTTTGVNKVYDGNTTATVTLSDDRILNVGDTFTDSYTTATFADKNVNNGITVSVSGISISGTGSGNYTLNSITTASTTANITPKTLTVTATGVNKVYDGNTTATVTLSDDRILNVGDTFTDSYTTATFADKNVNNGITVSVSGISISGTGSGNYTLNSITTASTTANITPKTLTVTTTGVNKVYDGNTTATVTLSDDRILNVGDTFTDSYTTATFADKNVNNGITVSVSGISISGTGSGNYTLNSITTASTTANITPKTLTVTATGVNKVYDGNTTATVTLSDDRILNVGDTFTDSYTTATFADKNVNNGITVSVSGISISGTGTGNYTLASSKVTTNANITQLDSCASYAYTGTTFANTDAGSTCKTVTLSVVITVSGNEDPASASVKFYNVTAGMPGTYIGTVPSSSIVVNPNNPKQAIYSFPYQICLGNNSSSSIVNIRWAVGENGGNFSNLGCTDAITDVTVSLPTSDFITGGGFIIPAASSGTHPSDVNTKVNFGFNAKWNKTLSNIQGSGFNAIIRGTDIINKVKVNVLYQIKGTKATALVVNATTIPYTASFTSNATLIEYDATGTTVLNSWGACTLTVAMTDVCEPGAGSNTSSDRIGITLKDNYGNLLYSNNWVSGNTAQQGLNGGNLQIHGDANTPAPPCGGLNTVASLKNDMPTSTKPVISNDLIKDPELNPLSVTVYPNPSPNYFNISMKGGSKEKVDVYVSDVLGHLLKTYSVTPGSSITLGDNFGVGIYIVQVRQGDTYKYYRIYKAPN